MVRKLAAVSILNSSGVSHGAIKKVASSSGVSHGATKKVASSSGVSHDAINKVGSLVASATSNVASHSSVYI